MTPTVQDITSLPPAWPIPPQERTPDWPAPPAKRRLGSIEVHVTLYRLPATYTIHFDHYPSWRQVEVRIVVPMTGEQVMGVVDLVPVQPCLFLAPSFRRSMACTRRSILSECLRLLGVTK